MTQAQSKIILLVEDDKDSSEILGSILEIKFPNARIYSAGDGKAGLDSFIRYLPDIVITDISMPEMDGTWMISRIPAIKADTRVIVVTAHSDRNKHDIFALTGVNCEIVRKPIDFKDLFASIECCLGR